jgi:hypothetical protein
VLVELEEFPCHPEMFVGHNYHGLSLRILLVVLDPPDAIYVLYSTTNRGVRGALR